MPDAAQAVNRFPLSLSWKIVRPPDLMLKKYKGKPELCYSIFSSPKHKYTKGGLPWERITNLTLEVNTFTWAWMSTRRAGA